MNPSQLRRNYPLGVFQDGEHAAVIGREKYSTTYRLVLGHGEGYNFRMQTDSPSIVLPLGRKEPLLHISDVSISQILHRRIMTYTADDNGSPQIRVAIHDASEEMDVWDVPSLNRHLTGTGVLVSEFMSDGQFVLVYGRKDIRLAFSKNLIAWHASDAPIASPRGGMFDDHPLRVVSATVIEQGILVVYESREVKRGNVAISIGAFLCSRHDPQVVVWRTDDPLIVHTAPLVHEPRVLGALVYEDTISVYLSTTKHRLLQLECANPYAHPVKPHRHTKLHRFARNPILSPSSYEWESHAVFNPAAFVDNGRVHLLYRAMGPDGVSRLGYASSVDGINFDERLDYPIYNPQPGFGAPTPGREHEAASHYDLSLNPSGGGWAGCEDPRSVKINDRIYVSYVAFDGWHFVRQALTSISTADLAAKNWKWRKPVLISKPGEIQKNWVIFPERINGKFAILHGLSPKVHVEYVDSLDTLGSPKFIESLPQAGGHGYAGRTGHWDTRVRGAGAPPIKTPMGWLLLYHGTDARDPGKYKLGAMILDLDDPTKILYRSTAPLLQPEEWYENDGKPGVVYTCGAVIVGENLLVYYGGGDKHIAVARTNVQSLLEGLVGGHPTALEKVPMTQHAPTAA